jgi:protein-tyrosine-phosphatase/DNA-binding transcriptional ArsR family regulator
MYSGRVRTTPLPRASTPAPGFLQLTGHPLRWRLLSELARSDRPVRELTALIDQRQSLTSYHLGRLRAGGLVSVRRSSADKRDTYYSLNLPACRDLLAEAGTALHPGLRLVPAALGLSSDAADPDMAGPPVRVIFLCTGNSSRSQMAEAIVERPGGARIEAVSAGSHPKPLHPHAVRAMRERGVDISGRHSKHLSEFADQDFDYVISLCDRVREVCPEFPGSPQVVHWSIPDPAAEGRYRAFAHTADELDTRIQFLLSAIAHTPAATSEKV